MERKIVKIVKDIYLFREHFCFIYIYIKEGENKYNFLYMLTFHGNFFISTFFIKKRFFSNRYIYIFSLEINLFLFYYQGREKY